MSPNFENENREALDEAEFDRRVNHRDYQPERWMAEAVESAGDSIGRGIALFGFWICLGLTFFGKDFV